VRITGLRDSSIRELNSRTGSFIAACGFEARSSALVSRIAPTIETRVALCFAEEAKALSRQKNEDTFRSAGFALQEASGNDSRTISELVLSLVRTGKPDTALAIDISSMTRAWHGAIIRTLGSSNFEEKIEIFFCYVPAKFSQPPGHNVAYEFVAPVEGFASLSPPDLPVAAIIGLGYEKERALGLQQLLDPKRTILMVPRFRSRNDHFHPAVLRSNRDILERTPRELQIDYWLDEPVATFGALASLVSKLMPSYRVVLASIGPKMLSVLCFLMAVQFPQVSVWRASAGIHGQPRQSYGDIAHTVVFSTTWSPND
jgi:hypothetical protein